MRLLIDRKRWQRGEYSMLLRNNGTMCCLGFLALACGYKKKEIKFSSVPSAVVDGSMRWPKGIVSEKTSGDTKVCANLMRTNDSDHLSEKVRERSLTRQFAKINIQVKFK